MGTELQKWGSVFWVAPANGRRPAVRRPILRKAALNHSGQGGKILWGFYEKTKVPLAFWEMIWYNRLRCPGVAQLVACLTGGQEAAGSSPVTRTTVGGFCGHRFIYVDK